MESHGVKEGRVLKLGVDAMLELNFSQVEQELGCVGVVEFDLELLLY